MILPKIYRLNQQKNTPKRKLGEWESLDYQQHIRGWGWIIGFAGTLIFIGVISIFFFSDYLTASTTFLALILYFYVHWEASKKQKIKIYSNGIVIDETFFIPWKLISGYWILYDETISVVYFEYHKRFQRIKIQLGDMSPKKIRNILSLVKNLSEMKDKKESLIDLWVRALKL